MKQQSKYLKSYTISYEYRPNDHYYSTEPKTLDEIFQELLECNKNHNSYKLFRSWTPTYFTAAEVEYFKEKGDFGNTYIFNESPLELANCLLDIDTNQLYNAYRYGVIDLNGNDCTLCRKYLGVDNGGLPIYTGFSSDLFIVPSGRLRYVSDRDLKNMGYPFKTDLMDSYMTY